MQAGATENAVAVEDLLNHRVARGVRRLHLVVSLPSHDRSDLEPTVVHNPAHAQAAARHSNRADCLPHLPDPGPNRDLKASMANTASNCDPLSNLAKAIFNGLCCAVMIKMPNNMGYLIMTTETAKLREIQARMESLMAGTVKPSLSATRSPSDNRLFAELLPADQQRAAALAALCMKIAKRVGGVAGLEAAVDRLYECLGTCPDGMVQYGAKLFLTHYKPAREQLQMRSLQERQPGAVQPSRNPFGSCAVALRGPKFMRR